MTAANGPEARRKAIEAAIQEFHARRLRGETLTEQDFIAGHAALLPELAQQLAKLRPTSGLHQPTNVLDASQPPAAAAAPLYDQATRSAGAFEPGVTIPGYRLIRELSRGGQGVVFQGLQESTNRKVAIKVLRHGPLASSEEEARFMREAQVLAALRHPHIVCVFDCGKTPEGAFFMVMEYVQGRPLDRWLADYFDRHPDGPPASNPSEILRMFMQIADAVNAAHLRGIVHRDLKPSNIHIDQQHEPRILDFGLAHLTSDTVLADRAARPVTITGQFLGSLPWASPEQAEGIPSKIDCRTDVYALGVILYQMLTGEFPYEVVGNMRDVLDNIMRAQPSPPSVVIQARLAKQNQSQRRHRPRNAAINSAVDAIVLKSLHKEPEHRYDNAGEMSRDIGNYLSGRPTIAGGPPPPPPFPWRQLAGMVVACAVVALLTWRLTRQPQAEPQPVGSSAGVSVETPAKDLTSPGDSSVAAQESTTTEEAVTTTSPEKIAVNEVQPVDATAASASTPALNAGEAPPAKLPLPSRWRVELLPALAAAAEPLSLDGVSWSVDGKTLLLVGRQGSQHALGLVETSLASKTKWTTLKTIPSGLRLSRSLVGWLTPGRDVATWSGAGSPKMHESTFNASAVATGLAWSPTARQLLTASSDGQLRLWQPDGRTPKTFAAIRPREARITAVDWSAAAGRIVAAISGEKQLTVLDENLAEMSRVGLTTDHVAFLATARSLPLVAVGVLDPPRIVLVDLIEKQSVSEIAFAAPPLACSWSADDELLAVVFAASGDGDSPVCQVYSRATAQAVAEPRPLGSSPAGAAVGWSSKGHTLAIGRGDGSVEFWSVPEGKLRGSLFHVGSTPIFISATGHYRGPRGSEKQLQYVVSGENEQQTTLSPDAFTNMYDFQNDPSAAQLVPQDDAH